MYACECMHIYVSMCICTYKYTNKSPIFYLSIRLSAYICFSFSFFPVSQFLFPPIFSLCLSLSFSPSVSPYFFTLSSSQSLFFSPSLFLSISLSVSLSYSLSLSLSLFLTLCLSLLLSLSLSLSLSFLLSLFREAILRTNLGDIHIKLFGQECPRTIENFSVRHRDN